MDDFDLNANRHFERAVELADRAIEEGALEEAVERWIAVLTRFPNRPEGYIGIVEVAIRLEQYELAFKYLHLAEGKFKIEGSEFARAARTQIANKINLEREKSEPETKTGTKAVSVLTNGRANIFTVTFFDFNGNKIYPGGAERYLLDLIDLLRSYGLEVTVYQGGHSRWVRKLDHFVVESVPWRGSIFELSRTFTDFTRAGEINIYSPFTLGVSNLHQPSIGICHGVYWDVLNHSILREEVARDVFSSLLHLQKVVSVDANSINVMRACRPDLAPRMQYLPNYVGEEFFKAKAQKKAGLTIIYPRRLYRPRGYWLLAEVVPELIREFPDVIFRFVGDGDPDELVDVGRLQQRFPRNVFHVSTLPENMPREYASADIAVIPTVHSEGTSLSALEALASGAVVVSTDVGGLSNIIIDELNGLLVAPDAASLAAALKRLIVEESLRTRLVNTGLATARSFSKAKWAAGWKEIIAKTTSRVELQSIENAPEMIVIHPRTDGIRWSSGSLPTQRPHHLLHAMALTGQSVFFVSDDEQDLQDDPGAVSLSVFGKNAMLYAAHACVYVYYAYHVWALGEPGRRWLESLSEKERTPFLSTVPTHAFKKIAVWFDLIDDPSLHANDNYSRAVDLFVQHADFVTTSSRVLYEKFRSVRPDLILVENACWPEDFLPQYLAGSGSARPAQSSEERIVGYVGAIAAWFDFELIEELAGRFPADRVVIAGPISPDVKAQADRLASFPNVSFIGVLPYESVPEVVRSFDVAILPFRVNSITDSTNPLKLYEYLSAGKVMVATQMREMQLIKSHSGEASIRIAGSGREFCEIVEEELIKSGAPTSARGFAMRNTWDHRADLVIDMLSRCKGRMQSGVRLSSKCRVETGNRVDVGRVVECRYSQSKDEGFLDRIEMELNGPEIAEHDWASAITQIYVRRSGRYRLDIRVNLGERDSKSSEGLSYSVSLADRELKNLSRADCASQGRIIADVELHPGRHELRVTLTITESFPNRWLRPNPKMSSSLRSISYLPDGGVGRAVSK